jgi:hypothetical protein
MLIVIGTAAAGTGVQLGVWPWYIHGTLAIITLVVNGQAFVVEYFNVRANAAVIDAVLQEVDRIRAERGLPSNEEALQEEGV